MLHPRHLDRRRIAGVRRGGVDGDDERRRAGRGDEQPRLVTAHPAAGHAVEERGRGQVPRPHGQADDSGIPPEVDAHRLVQWQVVLAAGLGEDRLGRTRALGLARDHADEIHPDAGHADFFRRYREDC